MPYLGAPFKNIPTDIEKNGIFKTKLLVPSIGSITQQYLSLFIADKLLFPTLIFQPIHLFYLNQYFYIVV